MTAAIDLTPITPGMLRVGDKVRLLYEPQRFTVQACNDRFAVCTRPFNLKRTVIYTVIDLQEQIRGTEDLIFCEGAETREQCEQMLARITSGETGISHRNRVALSIVCVGAARTEAWLPS